MNKETEALVDLLKGALRREIQNETWPLTIRTFMGMTPEQIEKLKVYWLEHHQGRLP